MFDTFGCLVDFSRWQVWPELEPCFFFFTVRRHYIWELVKGKVQGSRESLCLLRLELLGAVFTCVHLFLIAQFREVLRLSDELLQQPWEPGHPGSLPTAVFCSGHVQQLLGTISPQVQCPVSAGPLQMSLLCFSRLTDKAVKDYSAYRSSLLFWALVDLIYNMFKVRKRPGPNQFQEVRDVCILAQTPLVATFRGSSLTLGALPLDG